MEGGAHREVRELGGVTKLKLQKVTEAYTYQKDHDAHLIPINTYK